MDDEERAHLEALAMREAYLNMRVTWEARNLEAELDALLDGAGEQ